MKRFTLLLLLAFATATAMANEYKLEKSRSTERNFKVIANSSIALDVKYANVNVVLWDKNEIGVKAELKVSASTQSTLETVFNRIKIELTQSGNSVNVRNYMVTTKGDNLKNYSIDINYTISLPRDTKMDIINKYGNINLPAINRPLNVEHKYGNLTINDMVSAPSEIELKYGNINIAQAKAKLDIEIKYGNVKFGNVADVTIESGYCKLNAESIETLTGSTKYDTYKIGKLNKLNLSSAGYGGFTIGNITELVELNGLRYSNLRIDNVESKFKSITIPDASYTDIKIRIPNGSFKANTTVKYGKTRIYDSTSDGALVTNGGESTITINNRYGDITITK